jgi:hypothetical protein
MIFASRAEVLHGEYPQSFMGNTPRLVYKYYVRADMANTTKFYNGTACFKNVSNRLNTNIYSGLKISGGRSSNVYLNVVHFFTTSVK